MTASTPNTVRTGKTILIVEDEADILSLEKMALEAAGFRCLATKTTDEALEILKREKPDLIILDIVLPGRPGYVLSQEVRSHAETSSIPILCVSAQTEPLAIRISLAAGADEFIPKPFDVADVVERVTRRIASQEIQSSFRIFVADDDLEVLATVRLALESKGFEVETASNGAEAYDRIIENPPALVLLDVVMPGKTGFEICRLLRNRKEMSGVPIVIFTGESQPGYSEWAALLGATDYVTKDQGTTTILDRVQKLLGTAY